MAKKDKNALPARYRCYKCGSPVTKGAIIISPPSEPEAEELVATVEKYHICRDCWNEVKDFIDEV